MSLHINETVGFMKRDIQLLEGRIKELETIVGVQGRIIRKLARRVLFGEPAMDDMIDEDIDFVGSCD